jgi:hypothetical protein
LDDKTGNHGQIYDGILYIYMYYRSPIINNTSKYPLVISQFAIENALPEIVDLPMQDRGGFSIVFCKRLPEGKTGNHD